ncbi:MAG: sugar transferase [Cytophagales bacterium]|nr:MAG: sugar transferase [Cytophagales bacterium]
MVSNVLHVQTRPTSTPVISETRPADFTGKRIFDVCFALFISLLVLSWFIPIVSLLICLTSPGPPLFIQWRTGHNRRHFRCLKFRTMHHAPNTPFQQATRDDKRVTRLGAYLRRTNLDEMPQFLNVLVGDMSIVGPRPHAVQHDAQYWGLPGYSDRYCVRPGITGLSQVRGLRGETSNLTKMRHRLKFDLYYIRRGSLGLDLRICWLTVVQMVRGNINAW